MEFLGHVLFLVFCIAVRNLWSGFKMFFPSVAIHKDLRFAPSSRHIILIQPSCQARGVPRISFWHWLRTSSVRLGVDLGSFLFPVLDLYNPPYLCPSRCCSGLLFSTSLGLQHWKFVLRELTTNETFNWKKYDYLLQTLPSGDVGT